MNFRRAFSCFFWSCLLLSGLAVQASSAAPGTDEVLARVHWLGLKQIGADTNAVQIMKVWQLPQAAALVAQTLDKISRCPGHGTTNAASALLRPLLDDLITSEFYLELSAPTNSELRTPNSELLLALHLPADRAALWQTNLAAAAAALTNPATPQRIECSRAGDWTLVGVGLDKNISQTEFAAHLPRPRPPSATNLWLEADLNPSRLADCFSLSARRTRGEGRGEVGNPFSYLPSSISHLQLSLSGEAGYAHTVGTFNLSHPLESPLPPWEIPTNFIHSPLISFTAVRGLAPWLAASPAWQKLQFTSAPDQAYFWAKEQTGGPFVTYFAAPLPGASNQLSQLAGRLVQNVNPWIATNADGYFQWNTNLPGIVWDETFILSPFLKPATANGHDYLLGGLVPFIEGDPNPPPAEILRDVLGATNLVYYQTEVTGQRVEDDLFISQFLRVVFHKPQLPAKAAATLWLKNIEPLLGDSITSMTQAGAQQLAFTRYSTIGFNALELHLLADWLESPQFPHGLHTFLAPPDKN